MKSKNRICIFLFLILGLFSGLQASTTPVDLSNCQLIKISSEQIMVSDNELYILDAETQNLLSVSGFIHLEGEMYAIQTISPSAIHSNIKCGHQGGCFNCLGCLKRGCWNYCPGCK